MKPELIDILGQHFQPNSKHAFINDLELQSFSILLVKLEANRFGKNRIRR